MIVGNGMLAKKFLLYEKDQKHIIFASGVSNSKSKNAYDYAREFDLLCETISKNSEKKIVYFSTCSVYDQSEKDAPYVLHKFKIEEYIKQKAALFNIFRASNVVGISNNPNTILNYYVNHIKNKINFDVWAKASRNLIDIDDVFAITHYILQNDLFKNAIVNIANPQSYPVTFIVSEIENFFQKKANYSLINKGKSFTIDIYPIKAIIHKLPIDFPRDYLKNLLQKYFAL